MKYQDALKSTLAQMRRSNKVVHYFVGAPGAGKSALSADIAKALADEKGLSESRIVTFNPSLREPCDVLGLPDIKGDHTRWTPPEEFYRIRRGTGPAILRIEELADADMAMQNCMCRVILDRYAGELPLTDELYIIATGNRVQDKSGANRLTTKLANRMRVIEFQEDLDDWIEWATGAGIDEVLIAFLQFRPSLFAQFEATRSVNNTPRSWVDASLFPLDDNDIPWGVKCEHVMGSVGEGAGSEYMAFRRIFESLPDWDKIVANPSKAPIPKEADVQFALSAKLAIETTAKNIKGMWKYIKRMSPEITASIMMQIRKKDGISSTKEFRDWCVEAAKHI